MPMKKIVIVLIIVLFSLAGCTAAEPATLPPPPVEVQTLPEGVEGMPMPEPFSSVLPPEFMAHFEGFDLPSYDHPLLGAYETTSGCIMILMSNGIYLWQENAEVPAITGLYEVFLGTVAHEEEGIIFESDTGPLYTVIITFLDENAAMEGTIQVFDYYKEDVYRVTDLINDIWFEATRIPE